MSNEKNIKYSKASHVFFTRVYNNMINLINITILTSLVVLFLVMYNKIKDVEKFMKGIKVDKRPTSKFKKDQKFIKQQLNQYFKSTRPFDPYIFDHDDATEVISKQELPQVK